MRRARLSTTAAVLAAVGAISASPVGPAAEAATGTTTPTHFALSGLGYGTRVVGGAVPTGSDRTAYAVLGCTNLAGGASENHELQETLPGLGTASEDQTRVWTTQRHGVVSTYSRNTIAQVDVAGSPLGSLQLNGILALSRAFHDRSGFHATNRASVASITFTPAGGQPQPVDLPAPGQPVEVPGVATLSVGGGSRSAGAGGANASIDTLRIALTATGTTTTVGHAVAAIRPGVVTGVFGGYSSGTRGKAADGTVTSGRTPNLVMPCQGTGGHVRTRSVTQTRLTGGLLVQGPRPGSSPTRTPGAPTGTSWPGSPASTSGTAGSRSPGSSGA